MANFPLFHRKLFGGKILLRLRHRISGKPPGHRCHFILHEFLQQVPEARSDPRETADRVPPHPVAGPEEGDRENLGDPTDSGPSLAQRNCVG